MEPVPMPVERLSAQDCGVLQDFFLVLKRNLVELPGAGAFFDDVRDFLRAVAVGAEDPRPEFDLSRVATMDRLLLVKALHEEGDRAEDDVGRFLHALAAGVRGTVSDGDIKHAKRLQRAPMN